MINNDNNIEKTARVAGFGLAVMQGNTKRRHTGMVVDLRAGVAIDDMIIAELQTIGLYIGQKETTNEARRIGTMASQVLQKILAISNDDRKKLFYVYLSGAVSGASVDESTLSGFK